MTWTQERIDAVRARIAAATEGPWEAEPLGNLPPMVIAGEGHIWDSQGLFNDDDAEFIAHARQDLPAALDEIERLRGELAVTNDMRTRAADAIESDRRNRCDCMNPFLAQRLGSLAVEAALNPRGAGQ